MRQAPQQGGYIKLWRSSVYNGHLRMPHAAWKVFTYLMMQVNRRPNKVCGVGEGLITYHMIQEECSEENGPLMSSATISRALRYLEGNNPRNERYVELVKGKNGRAQKIRIINYRKHQDDTTSLATKEVTKEVTKDKQEGREEREEGSDEMHSWVKWYEEKFAISPSGREFADFGRLQERGVTDDFIIAAIEDAIAADADRPLLYAKRIVSDRFANGVKTADDYRAWKERKSQKATPKAAVVPPEDEATRAYREFLEAKERDKMVQ